MKIELTLAAALAITTSVALAEPKTTDMPKANPAAKAPEAAKMVMPKPDAQIAQIAKSMGGTWRCTGKAMMDPAGGMVDAKATYTNKLANELDKWWIQTNFSMPMGKSNMKFIAYTTFNSAEKKWMRYAVDNMGGAEWSTSMGTKDNKIVWEGDAIGQMAMGGSHKAKVRHTEDVTDPKNVKMKGEYSMDGRNWMAVYEMTCKK